MPLNVQLASCREHQVVDQMEQTLSKSEDFKRGGGYLSLGDNYCQHEVVILLALRKNMLFFFLISFYHPNIQFRYGTVVLVCY